MSQKYSGRLFPLEVGQVITISGKTNFSANRFEVELANGNALHGDIGDIPFHMSVRFDGSGEIVRNSHVRNGGWGHEERQENLIAHGPSNPIRKGLAFKIAIFIDSSMFFVSIDEKPFCLFPHRRPLNEIQRLNINRDVEAIYQVDQISAQPSKWPSTSESCFSGLAPKNFRAGSVIVFTAIPRGGRGDFAFNLRENGSGRILLHVRPYFGNGCIVTNDQDVNKG